MRAKAVGYRDAPTFLRYRSGVSSQLHVTRIVPGVVRLEIDAPPTNALNHALRLRLEAELDRLDADTDARCVILTGHGPAAGFCSGDDLHEAARRGAGAPESLAQFARLFDKLEALRVPVVAAIHGHAIGGGLELTLACDIRIASDEAWLQGVAVNMGLIASAYRLPRLIGIAAAKAMLLTGTRVHAEQALAWGLVTAVHPVDRLQAEALALAVRIASRAPLSVEATKRVIGQALDLSQEEGRSVTASELAVLADTDDHHAAVRAFVDRSEPSFRRR